MNYTLVVCMQDCWRAFLRKLGQAEII